MANPYDHPEELERVDGLRYAVLNDRTVCEMYKLGYSEAEIIVKLSQEKRQLLDKLCEIAMASPNPSVFITTGRSGVNR